MGTWDREWQRMQDMLERIELSQLPQTDMGCLYCGSDDENCRWFDWHDGDRAPCDAFVSDNEGEE